jgi:hypothetical protein
MNTPSTYIFVTVYFIQSKVWHNFEDGVRSTRKIGVNCFRLYPSLDLQVDTKVLELTS